MTPPYLTRRMDEEIKAFQKHNGLTVDGRMLPGGETETVVSGILGGFLSGMGSDDDDERQPKTGKVRKPHIFTTVPLQDDRTSGGIGFGGGPLGTLRNGFGTSSHGDLYLPANGTSDAKDKIPKTTEIASADKADPTPPSQSDKPAPPVPQEKPYILGKGKDEAVQTFIKKYEQPEDFLYKDNEGNMTVGVGHKVNSIEEMQSLPFYIYEGNKAVRPATQAEITDIYQKVSEIQHSQKTTASRYDPENLNTPNIRMRAEDQDALFRQDLQTHADELRKNWPDFDKLPAAAQTGMLDAQFNMGSSRFNPQNWPKLNEALKKQDWDSVAREIHRETAHEERNIDVQNLILSLKDKQNLQ